MSRASFSQNNNKVIVGTGHRTSQSLVYAKYLTYFFKFEGLSIYFLVLNIPLVRVYILLVKPLIARYLISALQIIGQIGITGNKTVRRQKCKCFRARDNVDDWLFKHCSHCKNCSQVSSFRFFSPKPPPVPTMHTTKYKLVTQMFYQLNEVATWYATILRDWLERTPDVLSEERQAIDCPSYSTFSPCRRRSRNAPYSVCPSSLVT